MFIHEEVLHSVSCIQNNAEEIAILFQGTEKDMKGLLISFVSRIFVYKCMDFQLLLSSTCKQAV